MSAQAQADIPYEPPTSIVFISGGGANASEVTWAEDWGRLLDAYYADVYEDAPTTTEELSLHLVTNHGATDFPGISYTLDEITWDRLADLHQKLVMAAKMEGLIREADVVITFTWYVAFLVRALNVQKFGFRKKPTMQFVAKAPEPDFDVEGVVDEAAKRTYYEWVGDGAITLVATDNAREVHVLEDKVRRAHPSPDLTNVRRQRTTLDRFPGWRDDHDEGRVVWTGRMNTVKRFREVAEEVLQMLRLDGVDVEAFVPHGYRAMKERDRDAARSLVPVEWGLPPEEFQERAGSATVMLDTGKHGGIATAILELACQGVVPVMAARPWNEDVLPGWPLRAKSQEQLYDLCRTVLDDPQPWRNRLRDALEERYGRGESNLPVLVDRTWRTYLSTAHEPAYADSHMYSRMPTG